MYLTPIVYPLSMIPEKFRFLYAINPMVSIIEVFRYSFFGNSSVTAKEIFIGVVVTMVLFISGVVVFSKKEKNCIDFI